MQRARCAGGGSASGSGSNSLNEAEVLLRVQLGCGLLSEAFCDLRRHCRQVGFEDTARAGRGFEGLQSGAAEFVSYGVQVCFMMGLMSSVRMCFVGVGCVAVKVQSTVASGPSLFLLVLLCRFVKRCTTQLCLHPATAVSPSAGS